MRNPLLAAVAALLLVLGVAACGSSSSDSGSSSGGSKVGGSLNGAGATFPAPVYNEFAAKLKDKQGTTVNYNAIGSGGGIAQFTAGTVDFGASDSPFKPEERTAAEAKNGPSLQIPTVFGAITISYNLSGVDTGLKLDGPTVADIFAGRVTKWNDPKIATANPDVKLPDAAIETCHRSDSSGTTKNFTKFTAAYDSTWEKTIGVDKTVKWPGGTGAKGNDGVAACIKQTDNAVGYVEQAYALQNNFTFASIKNKSGSYIAPTLESTSAAGDGLEIPADLDFSPIDAAGAKAYPITSTTFLLVAVDACKQAGKTEKQAQLVKDWVSYALNDGQAVAKELQYAPLPAPILAKAKTAADTLVCNGTALKADA
jgi:phosphate transport system substrate-binding protein